MREPTLEEIFLDYYGEADMRALASRLATASTLPIMLDSTEPAVLQAGLECLGGRCAVNSVNYEDGDGPDSRFTKVTRLAVEHEAEQLIRCSARRRKVAARGEIMRCVAGVALEKPPALPERYDIGAGVRRGDEDGSTGRANERRERRRQASRPRTGDAGEPVGHRRPGRGPVGASSLRCGPDRG